MPEPPADDERWMRHALALAARGRGAVEPNPMVGAVVLAADGRPVGDGWHQRFGGPHAEVHALAAAGEAARGGTVVVTLEPCCHHGKTPPCTDALLRAGVRRVVVATADPFPQVAGGGLAVLRAAGVAVRVGVCEADARRLNAPYFKRVHTGRPWVVAKWAMSLDGRIATRTGDSKWVTGPAARQRVHELRGRVDAVVVGRGTVVADDPLLTARPPGVRVATRVVLTASGRLPDRCRLRATATDGPVVVYTAAANAGRLAGWAADGAAVVGVPVGPAGDDGGVPVDAVLADLGRRRATNVLVEGGAGVLGRFFDAGAVDEAWVFVAPVVIGGAGALAAVGGGGTARLAAALRAAETTVERVGGDVLVTARFARGG